MSKTLTLNLLSAAVITLVAATAAPQAAHAGEQDGVKCPAGYDATISNGNKKLTCSKERTFQLASICSPIAFNGNGKVNVNTNITMNANGSDTCLAAVTGAAVASVMAPPPVGYPAASMFQRVVRATQPDVFEAKVLEFKFPEGGHPYLGNAVNGVSCAPGFDGDSRFSGRGIRCDKLDGAPKNADCDFPWSILRDEQGNKDVCILANQRGETKPQGMTHVQLDIERALPMVGWVLDTRNGTDRWQRKVYEFPRSN